MPPEAQTHLPHGELQFNTVSTIASGEVRQMPDGRAGVRMGLNSIASGQAVTFATEGIFKVVKSTSVAMLPGQEIWWDPTNNVATHKLAAQLQSGFFLGLCDEQDTVASATSTVKVDLNKRNTGHFIDLNRDSGTMVMTAAGLFTTAGMPKMNGGALDLQLIATNEAECVDWLSDRSIPVTGDPILEFELNVVAAAAAATDINVGLANASSTTDADGITESLFIHIDGASQNILAESDDGTTEVAATDTTLDWVAGTPFFVQMDLRNPADIQIYINGTLVLPATAFVLTGATGPLKILVHLEKSAATDTARIKVTNCRLHRCLTV